MFRIIPLNNICMYPILLFFIFSLLSFTRIEFLFATTCELQANLPNATELQTSVDRCTDARS